MACHGLYVFAIPRLCKTDACLSAIFGAGSCCPWLPGCSQRHAAVGGARARAVGRRREAFHKNFVGRRVLGLEPAGEHGPRAGADLVAARDVGRLQQEVAPAVVVARDIKSVLGPVPGAFSNYSKESKILQ